MLAVILFIAFWVIVALALFLVAARPGRGGMRSGRAGTRSAIMLFLATSAVFGVAVPLLMLTGNHSNASANVGNLKLTVAQRMGRELFGEHCGVCHTLAAANAVGKIGPDLDLLRPTESIILRTIANGCLPNPPANSNENCLGQGVMPAQVVTGQQAQDVASFVAKVTAAGG